VSVFAAAGALWALLPGAPAPGGCCYALLLDAVFCGIDDGPAVLQGWYCPCGCYPERLHRVGAAVHCCILLCLVALLMIQLCSRVGAALEPLLPRAPASGGCCAMRLAAGTAPDTLLHLRVLVISMHCSVVELLLQQQSAEQQSAKVCTF
jgi:hypothetical protein